MTEKDVHHWRKAKEFRHKITHARHPTRGAFPACLQEYFNFYWEMRSCLAAACCNIYGVFGFLPNTKAGSKTTRGVRGRSHDPSTT